MGIVINHSENIFLPQMIITKPEMEEKVEAFVKNGGTVIVTYRHAVKMRTTTFRSARHCRCTTMRLRV